MRCSRNQFEMPKFKRGVVGEDGLTGTQRELKLRLENQDMTSRCHRLRSELNEARRMLKQRPAQPCRCRDAVRQAVKAFRQAGREDVTYSPREVTKRLLDALREVDGFLPLAAVCDVETDSQNVIQKPPESVSH